jgi:serine-type D-Ala-D-Ala carboxypeptidase/endopeptidase
MKTKSIVLLFSLSISWVVQSASSVDRELLNRIKNAIEPQIGTQAVGAVVGVYDQGSIQFLSFGKKNKELPSAPDENTIFEIGSLTKTFTSLLFSRAIDLGLVTEDMTLAEIRPEWRGQVLGGITLIELATHRSGLPRLPCDLHFSDSNQPYADYTEAELINSISDEIISAVPKCMIEVNPTNSINYSNWGSALLGNAIAAQARSTYAEILRMWITEPLQLNDTVVDLSPEQNLRLAQGYSRALQPMGIWKRLSMFGNGAILSSAKDLGKYAHALLHPETTLIESSIRRVQIGHFNDGNRCIGLNWLITPADAYWPESIWHNGLTYGFGTMFRAYAEKDFAVWGLMNTEHEVNCLTAAVENFKCNPLTGLAN